MEAEIESEKVVEHGRWRITPKREGEGFTAVIERADRGLIHCGYGIAHVWNTVPPSASAEQAVAVAISAIDAGLYRLHGE